MLPKGKIIMEKKLTLKELIGIDDSITSKIDGFLFIPEDRPNIIQVYIKENEQLIGECPIGDILKLFPKEMLIKELRKYL